MTALERAEQAVHAAQADTRTLELVAAVLAAQQQSQQQAPPVAPAPARPTIRISGGTVALIVAGILVAGAVLTSLLLAVAVAGGSVAVCALVARWIIRDMRRH